MSSLAENMLETCHFISFALCRHPTPFFFARAGMTGSACTEVEDNFWSGAVSYFIYGYAAHIVFHIIAR